MRSRIITLLTLALLPTMLWASGNTVGRGDLSVSFEASHSNTQMVDTIHIKGPLGSLSAEMLLPKGFDRENGRCELVILLHGFLGSKKAAPLGFLARMLVEQGYAVLRLDFDGYGKSEGAQVTNTVLGMIQDAMAVWEYASAHCDPVNPPDSINVYGFKLGREYILSAQTLPIEEESAWYTGPVCLLHGTSDRIVPISYSERYHQLYRHSEFHRLRGTEHLFLFHRRKVRHLILEFLSREKQ